MVKFLIALAEMFSAFASKLHDLSENVDDDVVTRQDVKDMIDNAVGDEIIMADDIKGLDEFVSEAISERIDHSSITEDQEFYMDMQRLILNYAYRNGVSTTYITMYKEERELKEYMAGRYSAWMATRKQCEATHVARILGTNNQVITIGNHNGKSDVKI